MKTTNNVHIRIGVLLVAVAALVVVGIVPLLGTAQDATPSGDQESELIAQGEQIFNNVCIACHQPEGAGIEGIYPPLNGNPLLTGEDPTYFISTVLTGRGGMPAFAGIYTDEEIASVISYVRQGWDNDAPPVSPEEVAAVRAELFPELEEDAAATPDAQSTPFGQRPSGVESASPEAGLTASPPSTPEATP